MIRKTEPNIVPLCDILLVLLIIFMVITPMGQSGIDIKLPLGGPGDVPIVLTISGPDHFSLNRHEHFSSLDLLGSRLKEIFQPMRNKYVYIDSNRHVSYKDVIRVLDVARGADVDHIVLMTRHK